MNYESELTGGNPNSLGNTIKENIKIIKKLSKDRRKAVSRLAKKLLSIIKE